MSNCLSSFNFIYSGVEITNNNAGNIQVGTSNLVVGANNNLISANVNYHSSGIVGAFSQGVTKVTFFDTGMRPKINYIWLQR